MGQVYFKVVFCDVSTLISNFVVVSSVTLLYCFVARYSLPFYVMTLEKGAARRESLKVLKKWKKNSAIRIFYFNYFSRPL